MAVINWKWAAQVLWAEGHRSPARPRFLTPALLREQVNSQSA